MVSPQQIEQSYEHAELALASMRENGSPATIENFSLWFAHHSGDNIALSQSIVQFQEKNVAISDERCRALYDKFCSENNGGEFVDNAADRVSALVGRLGEEVDGATSHTAAYHASLVEIGDEIGRDKQASTLLQVITDLKDRTQEMQECTASLQTELRRNTGEIEGLRDDLASARMAAHTDQLTGIGNRKKYDESIREEADAAVNSGEPMCVLIADIDHFKQFNDRFGHQIGDIVLRLVAKKLQAGIKGRDILARYGGEEFVVILPMTGLVDATALANQLRAEVAGNRVVLRGQNRDLGHITLSMGIAEFDAAESVEALFERADAALYEAKNGGRNRVVAASPAALPQPMLAAAR